MPRSTTSDDTRAQNRINQQRCRARKQALIKDLSERVSRYEAAGVQASIDLQKAARKVEEENQKLRELLRQFVSDKQVDNWLQHKEMPDIIKQHHQHHNQQPFPMVSVPTSQASSTVSESSDELSLEMECTVAAGILAQMQGHSDSSRTRRALGCTGPEPCAVKNTQVFDLMDSY